MENLPTAEIIESYHVFDDDYIEIACKQYRFL